MAARSHPMYRPSGVTESHFQPLKVIGRWVDDSAVGPGLKAAGMAVPASVDAGYIWFCPRFGWSNLSLGERLRAEMPIPVLVDNDLTAGTTAELLYRTV
jgi:predicted NBD/HSP70 family sugar kinase